MKRMKRMLSMLLTLAILLSASGMAEARDVVSAIQEEIVEEQGALSLDDFDDIRMDEPSEDDGEAPDLDECSEAPEQDEDVEFIEEDDADGEDVEVFDTTVEVDPLMVVANTDSGEIALADEADKTATAYEPSNVEVTIKKNAKAKVFNGDTLTVTVEGKAVQSWSTSKKSVATVEFDGEKAVVTTHKVGSATLTAELSKKKKITLKLTVADPYVPEAVSLTPEATQMYVGYTMDLSQALGLTPTCASTTYTWKSSKKDVASVSKAGVLTAKKAGKAKITVTTKNKKTASVTITVKANKLDNLNPKPAKADISAVSGSWTLWPKSVEILADGRISCEFYLLNGAGSTTSKINNLQLSLYNGETLMAEKTFATVKVSAKKKTQKVFKVTFAASDVREADYILPDMAASQLKYALNPAVTLKAGKSNVFYTPTRIYSDPVPVTGITLNKTSLRLKARASETLKATLTPGYATNRQVNWTSSDTAVAKVDSNGKVTAVAEGVATVTATSAEDSGIQAACTVTVLRNKYRALCIGQTYPKSNSPLPMCETDAKAMAKMLQGLTPGYKVTTKLNRTGSQILSDIKSAFKGATSDDVSLFYYSGHGFGDIESYSGVQEMQGALCGVNLDSRSGFISTQQLANALSAVPGKVIVILDSCHSGAAISSNGGKSTVDMGAMEAFNRSVIEAFSGYTLDYDLDDPNLVLSNSGELATNKFIVMTASSYWETSVGARPVSIFTRALLEGTGMKFTESFLAQSTNTGTYTGSIPADTNRDKTITLGEAFNYAKPRANALIDELNRQIRQYYYDEIGPDWEEVYLEEFGEEYEDGPYQTAMCWGTNSEVLFSR